MFGSWAIRSASSKTSIKSAGKLLDDALPLMFPLLVIVMFTLGDDYIIVG